ncbi:pentatricopeptide repeat-containing protein At2g46050, mitochondrial isoform X1 [Cucurbita moschata]|uniref:Pentatricopeptide repeat-containing protein At2g46050, mitochondrial isoform X1 n=2 Tax=Cucurbita moschata TaxID=3662 RepID=A0A6J1H3L2_CUCMO|nr:pentatricopeptide repeat-containing protein At2g46050, mitochondrial isoform X1 [Cucurbita moschata]XP_022958962.1 pentatricopeptide repeat-containing protein At2g46050, mitochondrial isoform X1 [Cucurbita moschata]XP_022958963.1 pentatricopeptide repeat-containing protein At2g46050, mitochondrial isoform X1 [Cucurbita moschata]
MLIWPSTHFGCCRLVHSFSFNVLKAAADLNSIPRGTKLHSLVIKLGLANELSVQNKLLKIYVKCRDLGRARNLFDEMRRRNVVSWNTVICGVVNCGYGGEFKMRERSILSCFKNMLMDMVDPDGVTFNGLFRSCDVMNDVGSGKQLHGFVIKIGFDLDCFVGSAVVDFYAKCGLYEDARLAFSSVLYKDLVLWNVMLYCYVFNCLAKEAIEIFFLMQLEGFTGDDFTFSSLLSSCKYKGSGELGKQLHVHLIKHSFDLDILVASSLVNMYAKNNHLYDARKAFDEMPIRNSVSWTTMIVGYGQQEHGKEAVKLLRRMFEEDYYPDELTFASVLSSCGFTSGASELIQVHSCLIKLGFEAFLSVNNGLINAYSKCGTISPALRCFRLIAEPDLVSWTSIICGFAFCGLEKAAVELFDKMLSQGIRPDKIAFLGVLSACSHGGFVNMGLHYFNLMTNEYQIVPDSEHLTCLIDLIGRAGSLDEAFKLLKSVSEEAGPDAFRSFIRACRTHGRLRLAKWAMEFASDPCKPVNSSLMSNMYASEGRWSDVARMRKLLKDSCEPKVPGFSWIEIAGYNHLFVSSDRSHPQSSDLYEMLGLLLNTVKKDYKSTASNIDIEPE